MRVLTYLGFIAVFLFLATYARAQDPNAPDLFERAATTSPVQIGANDPLVELTWTNCLILDGDDPNVPANHFDCQPIDPTNLHPLAGIPFTPHNIVFAGTSKVLVRGVTVNGDTGLISPPSPNTKEVDFVPLAPTILSGGNEVSADLA